MIKDLGVPSCKAELCSAALQKFFNHAILEARNDT